MKRLACLLCCWIGGLGAQPLAPTPHDALGPFYPDAMPADTDSDLVRIAGRAELAQGRVIELLGRVLDTHGAPLAGVLIELWQTDARGRYIHSADPQRGPRDPAFQGFGTMTSDAAGGYRFRTVLPGSYGSRPPHLHVRLLRAGRELLVTQLYLPGQVAEPGLSAGGRSAREALQTVRLEREDSGREVARFDFVLDSAVPRHK